MSANTWGVQIVTDYEGSTGELSVETTLSASELWSQWLSMADSVEKAGTRMTETGDRWKQAVDPTVKNGMWAEYETAARGGVKWSV